MVSIWKQASLNLRLLLSCSFLMALGFYSLVPKLAIHFTQECGWTMTAVGLLLATRQLSGQGLMFLGGVISDRIGWKRTLVLGVLLRGIGFASFAFAQDPAPAFGAAAISGMGGALFDPAYKTAYDRLSPAQDRPTLIAFREVMSNVALGSSGLVGVVLAGASFATLSIVAGSAYVIVAAVVALRIRNERGPAIARPRILREMSLVATHRSFLAFTLLLTGYYYLVTQLYLSVPQAVLDSTHDQRMVTALYTVIAVTVIALQLRMTSWIRRYTRRFELIGLGTLVVGLSLLIMGSASGPLSVIAAGVLFACGSMIAGPVAAEVVPRFASQTSLGAYYGFNGYAVAVGGAGSAALTGVLFDLGKWYGLPALPWIAAAAVATATCAGLWLFERELRRRQASPARAATPESERSAFAR